MGNQRNIREIIAKTMENMYQIYRDVGHIAQIIEEKMRGEGFKAMGDAAITWAVSAAYSKPEDWLYRWFARVFLKEEKPKSAVGYCIHLGKYTPEQEDMIKQLGISFPFLNISLLENFEKEVKTYWRTTLYDTLWGTGWHGYKDWVTKDKITDKLVYGSIKVQNESIKYTTYFVDLLALTNEDVITRLVVEPMVKMFNGNEEWVSKNNLDVIKLSSNHI